MPRIHSSVLIIDNDLPTLELYRRELSRDYKVLACLNEEEALGLVQTDDLRAVVLEPAISGGNGWFLLSMLVQVCKNCQIPIVLCSTQDERRRGITEGAVAFLVKPVLPMELRETLRSIIG